LNKLDILALAAHPDDVELCCSGTLIKHINNGYKAGIVDFTKGEMGTRGTPELRLQEADNAGKIMGLSARENLGFKDTYFTNDDDHKIKIIEVIRKYQPEILLINAPNDRHPDHGRAHLISKEAAFLSGLQKIETSIDGIPQKAWRPKTVYSYIQGWFISPDLVMDVSDVWEQKMESIFAYKSQFFDPNSSEPDTWLSSPKFMELIKGRAAELGQAIGAQYGEGFITQRWIGTDNLLNLK